MSSPSRRTVLLASGTALLAAAAPRCAPSRRGGASSDAPLVVRGGTVYDGTGAPGVRADVLVRDGRVLAVGPDLAARHRDGAQLDAGGLAVAPGFIDIHSHADGTLFEDPRVESTLRQGVTTVVTGQDGASAAPSTADDLRARDRERPPYEPPPFATLPAYLAAVARRAPAVNLATMVGLGRVRHAVVGDADRPATPEELARMTALVDAALAAGACGASTGLEYTPGAFASREELIALCRPLAARGLPYATHMRSEGDALLESIDEAIAVARGAGCPLQVSHLKAENRANWPKLDAALARIEGARRTGLDAAFDVYPYDAYQTGLSTLFPTWSRDGGTQAFLARLRAADAAPRVRAETLARVEALGGWDHVAIASVAHAGDRGVEGARLGAYAAARGVDPYELAVGLLERSADAVGMVGFAMDDASVARLLAHPLAMVCSDGGAAAIAGPARRGHPHPRWLGAFPRVLARYVREQRALSLSDAIHKMTGRPAARVGLADRGRVAPGFAADLVVFDPARVRDAASYAAPFAYPEGIAAVLVNGRIALHRGVRAPARTGRVLRPARRG